AGWVEAFDGGDRAAGHGLQRGDAGSDGLAVEVHRAGPALADAAAELRALQPDLVTDHPEQGNIVLPADAGLAAIDGELGHFAPARCAGRADAIRVPAATVIWRYRRKRFFGETRFLPSPT